jgi:hypothetical protein
MTLPCPSVTPPDPEAYAAALRQYGLHPVRIDTDVVTITVLVGALQLAVRHPQLPAQTRAVVTAWLAETIATVGTLAPDIEALLRLGQDPAYDIPCEEER